MAKQTVPPLPLPKNWPQKVRSVAVHAIALARLALTTARSPGGTIVARAGLPPAGTTNLSRHTWTNTPEGTVAKTMLPRENAHTCSGRAESASSFK
jgi:hypothetical protein